MSTQQPPRIGEMWQDHGGIYCGGMASPEGDYHILAIYIRSKASHADARARAARGTPAFTDYALPTRRELIVIGANAPHVVQREFCWTADACTGGSAWAWGYDFALHREENKPVSELGTVVMVRRVPIQTTQAQGEK